MVHPPEQRRVFARDGHTIVDVPAAQPLDWPVLAQRLPVMQNEHPLGEVEIVRSFRPVAMTTVAIGVVSLCFGLLLVVVLRIVPLRLMREALERASYLSAHDHLTGLPTGRC